MTKMNPKFELLGVEWKRLPSTMVMERRDNFSGPRNVKCAPGSYYNFQQVLTHCFLKSKHWANFRFNQHNQYFKTETAYQETYFLVSIGCNTQKA